MGPLYKVEIIFSLLPRKAVPEKIKLVYIMEHQAESKNCKVEGSPPMNASEGISINCSVGCVRPSILAAVSFSGTADESAAPAEKFRSAANIISKGFRN